MNSVSIFYRFYLDCPPVSSSKLLLKDDDARTVPPCQTTEHLERDSSVLQLWLRG